MRSEVGSVGGLKEEPGSQKPLPDSSASTPPKA